MIEGIWKFVHERILSNVFSISLLLLGMLVLVIAVSLGPKLLQKEKKNKRGAIEKKVEIAFKKEAMEEVVDEVLEDELEDSVKEDEEVKDEDVEDNVKEDVMEIQDTQDDTQGESTSTSPDSSKATISSKRRTRKK